MEKIQKLPFFLAIILAGVFLYFLGDIKSIQADTRSFTNSLVTLILLHLFFFVSLTFFLYKILVVLLTHHTKKHLLLISCIIASVFTFMTVNPPFFETHHAVSATYIIVGDVLRDRYGINWYFMDWGGWEVTMGLYCLAFYTYFFYDMLIVFKILINKFS